MQRLSKILKKEKLEQDSKNSRIKGEKSMDMRRNGAKHMNDSMDSYLKSFEEA